MAAKKKIKKNNDEMIKWAGLIALLLLLVGGATVGAYYAMQPDPVAPALAMQKEMENLPWDQRGEAFQKLRKSMEKLTPEQRYKVDMASPRLKKEIDTVTAYYALTTPEAKADYLANAVNEMKTRMEEAKAKREAAAAAAAANGETPAEGSRRGQGGPPGGAGGPGGPEGGRPTEAERDQFHRERVQMMLPEQRAEIQAYHQELRNAMNAAGMGGRGGPGGGGRGPGR